jgi:hypothetical protein
MIILDKNLGHQYFCVEGGFYFRAVDLLVEGVDIAERVHHRSLFDTVTTA